MASIYDWSKTPATNSTADSAINWQEGQPPNTVNNSARQMMARIKEFIDDTGVVTAGGTANAITLTLSSSVTAYAGGLRFAFTPATANTAATTINVNGIGAKKAFWSGASGPVAVNGGLKPTLIYEALYLASLDSGAGGFLITSSTPSLRYATKSANYTAVAGDVATFMRYTGTYTHTLTAAATLAADWWQIVKADGGDVTIDPDSSETINGAASIILRNGQSALIICTGATFYAEVRGDTQSGPQLQGQLYGLTLSNNATDATNDIDIAVGSAAADASPYYLMQLSSALTKQLDAAWAVGTNQGMRDTGSIADGWWYIYLIQRSDTGVTDVLASLSATSPTMPTNYDRKRRIGAIYRTSSAIKAFTQYGSEFVWNEVVGDLTTGSPSTAGALVTLTVPPLVGVRAQMSLTISHSTTVTLWVREASSDNTAPTASIADVYLQNSGGQDSTEIERFVNSSGQVRYRSSAGTIGNTRIATKGFSLPV